MQGRKKKLAKNTAASLIYQATTIICGFILPKLILDSFGSEVNGLVNSITQFLSVIAFLELGVGAVVQSSLYKPLAEKDNIGISKIIASAGKFFRKIANILLVYILILIIFYPDFAQQNFGRIYTGTLIAAIGISSFAQYYFGIVNRLVLTADQRGYIQYTAQTVTIIFNTIACVILIKVGASIHIVKLATSLIYLLRPLFLHWYVNKNYQVDRKIQYTGEPIKQKWNGVAQHVAAVVLDSTDPIVLTLFATLSDVSIYSVYHLVMYGVKQMFLSMTNGIQSLIGELWAKQELDELKKTFGWVEWSIHTGTVFVFGCTAVLILPFVQVYTKGITDAVYIQPLFAIMIVLAHAGHCLRLPYNIMILAGGHYKQTQNNYIVAALLNIVVSIATVKAYGLIGVAVGTLVAMLYQTLWMAHYDSKNLIQWPFSNFVRQIMVDVLSAVIGYNLCGLFPSNCYSYVMWFFMAIRTVIIWMITVSVINMIFYKEKMCELFDSVTKKLSREDK